jgi:multiple sugar transport system permease protein/raffinose/stachyose/melibiose transport system permease protein
MLLKSTRRVLLHIGAYAVVLFFMLPFLWMISVALKPPDEIFTFPPSFVPKHLTLVNFIRAVQPELLRYALNSVVVSTSTAVLTILVGVLSAYSFSRLRFFGRRSLLVGIIATQLLPLAIILIPIYRTMSDLNLVDTYGALIIAYLAFTVPVAVWLLRGFFANIPPDFEEAAMLDGCTRFQAFGLVVLPLSLPGIFATATYVFFMSWQELMFSLALINSQEMRTVPFGVLGYIGEHSTEWGLLMAASVLICIPVFVFFLLVQRQFIAGLSSGGVKG